MCKQEVTVHHASYMSGTEKMGVFKSDKTPAQTHLLKRGTFSFCTAFGLDIRNWVTGILSLTLLFQFLRDDTPNTRLRLSESRRN